MQGHTHLVTRSHLLLLLSHVHAVSNLGGLLLHSRQNVARLVVESLPRVIVANVLDGLTDDLLVVNDCLAADLTKNNHHTSFSCRLWREGSKVTKNLTGLHVEY